MQKSAKSNADFMQISLELDADFMYNENIPKIGGVQFLC